MTAGNSSPVSVGTAALLMMSEETARTLGLKPMARVRAMAGVGVAPEEMGIGPVPAVQKALTRAGLTLNDIDCIELNEAFAVQVLAVLKLLGINEENVNTRGGAIALGHPLGASGRASPQPCSTGCVTRGPTSAWRPCASGTARAWPRSSRRVEGKVLFS